jgi:hypothetical protein
MKELQNKTKEELINILYNTRIASIADFSPDENKELDKHGYGKRIPYIGWFWRSADFINKRISIGDCGDYVGVMENNKWGYAEREMTEDEVDKFIDYLERALLHTKSEAIFNELWDWFQTLRDTGDWCSSYSFYEEQ